MRSMKRNILWLLLGIILPLSAQVTVETFEDTYTPWETAVSSAATLIDNPSQTGLNLSCKVLKLTRTTDEANWAGAIYRPASSYTGYRYVHVLMYRNNSNVPNIKVYDPTTQDGSADIAPMTTIVANQWQDVVFDVNHDIDFLFFMVDRSTLTADAVMYIDDVVLSNDATPRTTPNEACDTEDTTTEGEYTLVWNADFIGSSLNQTAWTIEDNGDGGGNNELQFYCERGVSLGVDPVEGKHCLILTATKESYKGKTCTSGRINSLDKTYFTYGKIAARIWFPQTANGLWPAFWMMGNNYSTVGWPKCGELDIIELGHATGISNGTQDRYFNGAMHVGSAWNTVWHDAQSVTYDYSVEDGFHVISCEWTPTSVKMYVDKDSHPDAQPYFSTTLEQNDDENYNRQLVWSRPNFIIFNLAIGGDFPGIHDINSITALANGSRSMYVDWVRVYQRGDAGESFYSAVASDPIEAAPTGLEDVVTDENNQARKLIINGQLYIENNGHLYNAMGVRVQ